MNKDRLKHAKAVGFEPIDLTRSEKLEDLIAQVLGVPEVDAAIDNRIEALTSSGLVNASANRAAMRVGAEPLDLFREYMATYSREQAYCHLSPALVRNLEEHWSADRRSV